jgi:hypothetical protein
VQKIYGALGVGCGGEERVPVVRENIDPRRNLEGMILTQAQCQVEIGGKKRRTKFGDKFLHRVAFVAKAPAECLKGWHRHEIFRTLRTLDNNPYFSRQDRGMKDLFDMRHLTLCLSHKSDASTSHV